MKTFNAEFDIYFEDISPCGKIHLERLAEWSSTTREKYFKSTCSDHLKFIERPVKMFTTNLTISVMSKHSNWADKVTAILTTADIKKISFEMHIDFQNTRTKEIIARTIQKVAFIDTKIKKIAKIPQDMNSVIVNYKKSI